MDKRKLAMLQSQLLKRGLKLVTATKQSSARWSAWQDAVHRHNRLGHLTNGQTTTILTMIANARRRVR